MVILKVLKDEDIKKNLTELLIEFARSKSAL